MTVIAQNFKATPYWWEAAPPSVGTKSAPEARYDVVVIGSGVTGLSAALTLAEGGRKVAVCDSELIGSGASSRSNGAVSTNFGEELSERKFGATLIASIAKVAVDAAHHLLAVPERYGFDPLLKTYDRYILALSAKHGRHFSNYAEHPSQKSVSPEWRPQPLSNEELVARTGLTGFHGGLFIPKTLSMHPGLYTQGLADACRKAGVDLIGNCRVLKVERNSGYSTVYTQRGQVRAVNVIAATCGYTGTELPLLRKRMMNVRLYMAASEVVPRDLFDRIFPDRRKFTSSKENMSWIRPSPDNTRVLVGGCGGMMGDDPEKHAKALHDEMVKLVPDFAGLKLTHSWYGLIGFPHDFVPHIGTMDGIHHAMGYCGRGMALGSYLGTRLAHKILGSAPELSATPLDAMKFPREPVPGILREVYLRAGLSWVNFKDWWNMRFC